MRVACGDVCRGCSTGNWTGMTPKRELIEPNPGDKRFVRRDAHGRFAESVDVSRSLTSDARTRAKKEVKSGHGDQGDRRPRKKT